MDLTQRLAGKVAVITGGAGGIGLATGRRMHAEGARIVVGDIDPTAGKAAADELDGLFVPVDVSDEAAVDNLFDTAADTYGSVDIAFNNAGISPPDDAPVAFRGDAPSGPGYWFPPTVLTPSRTDRTVTEEIFGPVVTVLPFEDEADAIALANDTPYGLSGSIWTDNLSRALRVSRAVESGNLSVNSHSSVRYNTPFGGFKQSGLERELGPDAPLSFTETKNVFFAVEEL